MINYCVELTITQPSKKYGAEPSLTIINSTLAIARNLWLIEGLSAEFLKYLKFHSNIDTAINGRFGMKKRK